MATIGIMDPAFYVGRKELLTWINSVLELDYTKVEQMASGAAYCQLMDAAFPGQIPLSKVNFNARFDYEFVANFKVLQNHFSKIKCEKVVPVDRLIKAKYQDNLEFMQWMKRYFEMEYAGGDYDARARRKESKCEYAGDKGKSSGNSSSAGTATSDNSHTGSSTVSTASSSNNKGTSSSASTAPKNLGGTSASSVTSSTATSSSSTSTSTKKTSSTTNSSDRRASMMPGTGTTKPSVSRQSLAPARLGSAGSAKSGTSSTTQAKSDQLNAKVEALQLKVTEMTIDLTKAESTRDFYYEKLRAIEGYLDNIRNGNDSELSATKIRDDISDILFDDGSGNPPSSSNPEGTEL